MSAPSVAQRLASSDGSQTQSHLRGQGLSIIPSRNEINFNRRLPTPIPRDGSGCALCGYRVLASRFMLLGRVFDM